MNAPADFGERTLRIAARIDALVVEEARLEQARQKQAETAAKVDAEIMKACRAIALASDMVEQCKFAGASEFPARRKLDAAIAAMKRVMQKHGRGGV